MNKSTQTKEESLRLALGEDKEKQWYQLFPKLLQDELKKMEGLSPKFELHLKEGEEIYWEGKIGINDTSNKYSIPKDLAYNPLRIKILCKRDYPLSFPVFIDLDGVLLAQGCEHVNPSDNSLCYAFRPSTELDFINKHSVADAIPVIQSFLLKWYCKQKTGKWPGGEHLHGEKAFILWEFKNGLITLDSLCACGSGHLFKDCHLEKVEKEIIALNAIVLGYQWKKKLGRNDRCLCGSGRKYKKCFLMGEHKSKDRVAQLIQNPSLTEEILIDLLNGTRTHI